MSDTATFQTRALELHASAHIWSPKTLSRVLRFMADNALDTLSLHEVGILERLVYPGRYFGAAESDANISERYRSAYRTLYRYTPGRRSKPYLFMETIRWLLRRAEELGIEVYLNNKELFFPDIVVELHPQVLENGVLCPTDPFWLEFLTTKYRELYEDLPGLAGTITAPGTGESRLAISGNRCPCDRCAATTASEWYSAVIRAIHEPTAAAGKTLVLRDFVFGRAEQDALATAWADLPADIVICLKNTPHDYYPTFPDNARIGAVAGRRQWVEFDAMGQYFGWGVAPAILIEETRRRYRYAADRGATGVLVRVDWESLDGHSAFDTPNVLNLRSMATLAVAPDTASADLYRQWLTGEGHVDPEVGEETMRACVGWAAATFEASWPIVRGTLYADDCVISDSSSFPVGLDHLFWLAEEKNSLRDWDRTRWDALDPAPERVWYLIAEKEEALELWRTTYDRMSAGNPGLRADRYQDLVRRYRVFGTYVEGFVHVLVTAICARHVLRYGDAAEPEIVQRLRHALDELGAYLRGIRADPSLDWFPAAHLVNAERLGAYADDVTRRVAGIVAGASDRKGS
ncbi:hypothetical protein [Jiangella asiatica]|uniref:Uncharacterized protein n=1 Tax=Jiangella asiatica TaxID=2530372 RepID=A0A4R5C8C7_9ACTN|nr:hypothetical protein [Jiangella asiatica]TDD95405.1 hypothetical protein E1269_31260 [Jiangella asiatica]